MSYDLSEIFDKVNKIQKQSQRLETLLLSNPNVVKIGGDSIPSSSFSFVGIGNKIKEIFNNKPQNLPTHTTEITKVIYTLDEARKFVRTLNLKYLDLHNQVTCLERGVEAIEKQVSDLEKESLSKGLVPNNFQYEEYQVNKVNTFDNSETRNKEANKDKKAKVTA